jgi:hypothetical protein
LILRVRAIDRVVRAGLGDRYAIGNDEAAEAQPAPAVHIANPAVAGAKPPSVCSVPTMRGATPFSRKSMKSSPTDRRS